MRLATWNVAWFDRLFDASGRPLRDDGDSGRHGVSRGAQIEAIARVLRAIDADGVMLIEAPDTGGRRSGVRALERFAAEERLRTREAVIGFPSHTQQEIAFLHDAAVLSARHDPRAAPGAPRFDAPSGPARIEGPPVAWSKPPLELEVRAEGRALRLIGVHAKSKAPHGAETPGEARRIAIENRRKQLAQCAWLRARIEDHLEAGDSLVVLGDFNDGPGLDAEERLFGRSGVEVAMGEGGPEALRLFDPHARAALARPAGAGPATARFAVPPDWHILSALLDYVMVSPDLMACRPRWRIWHPLDDPAIRDDPALREALLTASDHFPVTLDLDLSGQGATSG
ncbi:endonuclease/exonuclease/phosphatase family protein [Limimaricola pyoseonensis]|uniref:Metal-dependent hydrolase, endonuclease/exonuclease/phosphatase family n=1 Tax=Limimaricola pyoseonensis TaxID=521013 RepID=A0A1G7D1Z5_9RHOB|nr:endonuclease/exonuclease/phosphatase family protein [Limimaricola pyoseonensis]SDE44946.1 Metal-dependent hydrolase, endonuclease/exonuclease/phosphatase family [Limimaricola pyoseonensis]